MAHCEGFRPTSLVAAFPQAAQFFYSVMLFGHNPTKYQNWGGACVNAALVSVMLVLVVSSQRTSICNEALCLSYALYVPAPLSTGSYPSGLHPGQCL